jgi:hypothetical protein
MSTAPAFFGRRVEHRDAASMLPALYLCLILAAWGTPARAQNLEPRAYSPAPVGLNFVAVGINDSTGGLSIDSALPINDAHLSVRSLVFGYARSINLWGTSGKIDVIVPYGKLSGSANYQGAPIQRNVDGFFDPALRVSLTLYGAPALSPAQFRNYRQDLLIAASVQVSVPAGQYDKERLLNLGAHRWSVKPEIGMSKAFGRRWTVEMSAAAIFYSINNDFFGGRKRSQDAIFTAQTYLIYNLPSGAWASIAATYFTGGKTSVDGIADRNLQKNWRLGLTAALPISRKFSIKFNASKGVLARTGNNFDQVGLALQYRWGAGF